MDDAAPLPSSSEISGSLTKWVDEMLNVIKAITTLGEESARHRALAEQAQREYADLCEEVAKLRTEVDRIGMLASSAERQRDELREEAVKLRTEVDRIGMLASSAERQRDELREEAAMLRAEVDRVGMLASSTERQRDEIREEVIMVRAENHRLRVERAEAGEAAAKLLGEVKDLVNEVAHKIQGPASTSPFDREARTPHS
jgi:chromosome segregation ATPase